MFFYTVKCPPDYLCLQVRVFCRRETFPWCQYSGFVSGQVGIVGWSFPVGVLRAGMWWLLKFWHVIVFFFFSSPAAAGTQLWHAGCICEMYYEQVPHWWLVQVKQWDGGTEGQITPPTHERFNDTAGISPIRASYNHQSDAQERVLRKDSSVYSKFLFSSSWHVTYQRLSRSKEALMATSYSPTVKRGNGKSANKIKQTGNQLPVKSIRSQKL